MKIAVLMTCRNRVASTLRCLDSLFASLSAAPGVEAKVFLVDDGSSDGTGERVKAAYGDAVDVACADGSLYWAKGMRLAWMRALDDFLDWDGFFWLNDDTVLDADAVAKLAAVADSLPRYRAPIAVGDLVDASGEVVYGMREGGLFTGNCVLVARSAAWRLGVICGEFSHAWADSDYALRAAKFNVPIVSAGVVGKATEVHPLRPSLKGRTFRERMRLLRDPKGWNLHDLWLFRRRNFGFCKAVASAVHFVWHVARGER